MDRNSRELDELQFAVKIAKRNIEQDIQSVKNKTEDIIEILK